jgi:hypothetical protein
MKKSHTPMLESRSAKFFFLPISPPNVSLLWPCLGEGPVPSTMRLMP